MSPKPKRKLCWNCEGNVSIKEETCPYCGVSVNGASSQGKNGAGDPLTPPYRLVQAAIPQTIAIPAAPYVDVRTQEKEAAPEKAEPIAVKAALFDLSDEAKQIVLTLALLTCGAVFLVFGIALLLFSHQGVFTLRWNATYWFLYFVFALPMLFIGYKSLQLFNEQDETKS